MKVDGNVVIIGAGPSGLSAGWKLAEAGHKVVVIDQEDQVGGLCRTVKKDGFYFDLGGHRFITKDAEVQAEIEALMGDDLLLRPRKSIICLKGNYLNYPLDIRDVITKFEFLFTIKAGLDYMLTTFMQKTFPRPDSSFENWIINRFGCQLYNLYFGPYSAKLWGVPPSTISADWAAQRISLLSLWDVFLRLLGKEKDKPKTYADQFYYPRQGIGMIMDKMAEKILAHGGEIHLNSRLIEVGMNRNKVKEIKVSEKGESYTIENPGFLINTIPLPDFVRMVVPRVVRKYQAVAEKMEFRSIRFLFVMLDKARVTDNTWIYVPEDKYVFFRIQETGNWSPYCVPDDKSGLTLEIACNEGDELWTADDKSLFERCRKDLEDLGFLSSEDKVVGYFSVKEKHCYPLYTLDYAQKVNTVTECIYPFKDFLSIGRQGLYRYNNMDHSIKMGFLTAKHVVDDLPKEEIFKIATEEKMFDWQDPGAR